MQLDTDIQKIKEPKKAKGLNRFKTLLKSIPFWIFVGGTIGGISTGIAVTTLNAQRQQKYEDNKMKPLVMRSQHYIKEQLPTVASEINNKLIISGDSYYITETKIYNNVLNNIIYLHPTPIRHIVYATTTIKNSTIDWLLRNSKKSNTIGHLAPLAELTTTSKIREYNNKVSKLINLSSLGNMFSKVPIGVINALPTEVDSAYARFFIPLLDNRYMLTMGNHKVGLWDINTDLPVKEIHEQ